MISYSTVSAVDFEQVNARWCESSIVNSANTNLSITNWWIIYRVSMATLYFLTNNYLFKVNNRNTRTWCETCLKLAIKTPCSSVSVVQQVIIGGVISFKQIEFYVWWRSEYWSYLILEKTEIKQCSCRLRWVLVHLVDSWWFNLALGGSGQFRIILWFILFILFIFSIFVLFKGIKVLVLFPLHIHNKYREYAPYVNADARNTIHISIQTQRIKLKEGSVSRTTKIC